jgi:hypothetical protein
MRRAARLGLPLLSSEQETKSDQLLAAFGLIVRFEMRASRLRWLEGVRAKQPGRYFGSITKRALWKAVYLSDTRCSPLRVLVDSRRSLAVFIGFPLRIEHPQIETMNDKMMLPLLMLLKW